MLEVPRGYASFARAGQERPAVRVVTGRALARLIRKGNPTSRAMLAADWVAGRLIVEKPTIGQASTWTRASRPYTYAARRLTAQGRNAVRAGRLKLTDVVRNGRPLNDDKLVALVKELGPDRVMSALDRITTPTI